MNISLRKCYGVEMQNPEERVHKTKFGETVNTRTISKSLNIFRPTKSLCDKSQRDYTDHGFNLNRFRVDSEDLQQYTILKSVK